MKPTPLYCKATGELIDNPEQIRQYHIEQARLALGDSLQAADLRRRKREGTTP